MESKLCFYCLILCLFAQSNQAKIVNWSNGAVSLYPSLPIVAPWSNNEACRTHSQMILNALNNFTLWAVQMVDSSSLNSGGVLYGNIHQLGNFDECLEVSGPVQAQYCLAQVTMEVLQTNSNYYNPFVQKFDPLSSVWDRLRIEGNPSRVPRNSIYQALCVPASCTAQDVETSVNQYLSTQKFPHDINYTVHVAPNLCYSSIEEPLALEDQMFIGVIASAVLLVIIGTVLDSIYGGSQTGDLYTDLLKCFSAKRNLRSLKPLSTQLDILNSLKFFCISIIIISHRGAYFGASPLWNLEYLEREFSAARLAVLHRADLLVDSFFVISGLLMAYLLLKELPKQRINAIYLILLRALRLTPGLSLMIFFYSTLFYKLGSGPRWDLVIGPERECCRKNWWTNLLFINNYVDEQNMCLLQSYFIACDMHFFIVAIPLVTLLWRRPHLGGLVLAGVTLISLILPCLITYLGQKAAIVTFYVDTLVTPRASEVFHTVYIKSHARASPFFIGIATGYLVHKLENTKIKLGMGQSVVLCWSISSIVSAVTMYGVVFYDAARPYNAFEAGMFAGFHRFIWALGTAAFIIIVFFGKLPLISAFLRNKVLVSLGNLVYGLVLAHPVLQYWTLGSLRRPEYFSYTNVILTGAGDLLISLVPALAIYLTVEEPFRQIVKLLFLRKSLATEVKKQT